MFEDIPILSFITFIPLAGAMLLALVLFVLLTTFLTPFCILASMTSVKKRMLEYMIAFLVLETLMIGVFVSLDLILFYLFFEAVLIPMFIIIGVWGGKNRVYASYKFFLCLFIHGFLMLTSKRQQLARLSSRVSC